MTHRRDTLPDPPLISVVIPTRGRPALVMRAVRSVLRQTLAHLESVVVVDGPDAETVDALRAIADPRLRVVQLPASRGGGGARNAGVEAARGEWVSFLDDDDEYLPDKLAVQLRAAEAAQAVNPVIACRIIARSPTADYHWPRRLPSAGEPISEFLLCRTSVFRGEGLVQTGMFFARRELFFRVPFRGDLRRGQDTDWILRAVGEAGCTLIFVPDPLIVWYFEEQRSSITRSGDWRYSLSWLRDNRHLVTPRAYADFALVEVGAQAARERDLGAILPLVRDAFTRGRPGPVGMALFGGFWLVPQRLRRWGRALVGSTRRQ